MDLKAMSTSALVVALAKVNAQRDALLEEARVLRGELDVRATLDAVAQATGKPLGDAQREALRAAAEADQAAEAEVRAAAKAASKERGRAMAAAWGEARAAAAARGETLDKGEWEQAYLAAAAPATA
jgi:hypothetical protein